MSEWWVGAFVIAILALGALSRLPVLARYLEPIRP